jgi:GGDEF domain-containing protein
VAAAWNDVPATGGLSECAALVRSAEALRTSAPELSVQLARRALLIGATDFSATNAHAGEARSLSMRAQAVLAAGLVRTSQHAGAVEPGFAALALAESGGALVLAAELRLDLAACAQEVGEPLLGGALLRPVLEATQAPPSVRAAALGRLVGCVAHVARRDDVEDALAEADRLLAADDSLNPDARRMERARLAVRSAAYHRWYGDNEDAVTTARDGLNLLSRLNRDLRAESDRLRARLVLELVCALLDEGELLEAENAARPIVDEPVRATSAESVGHLMLAVATRVHLPAGETERGRALLDQASWLAERHSLDSVLADALTELSRLDEQAGHTKQALEALRNARAAEQRRMRAVARAARHLLVQVTAANQGTRDATQQAVAGLLRQLAHPGGVPVSVAPPRTPLPPKNADQEPRQLTGDLTGAARQNQGLLNREDLFRRLRAVRKGDRPVALTLVRFEPNNDASPEDQGPDTGIMVGLADKVRDIAPENAELARSDGAELAVLLPHTTRDEAEEFAATIRETATKSAWLSTAAGKDLSISTSVVQSDPQSADPALDPTSMLTAARDALTPAQAPAPAHSAAAPTQTPAVSTQAPAAAQTPVIPTPIPAYPTQTPAAAQAPAAPTQSPFGAQGPVAPTQTVAASTQPPAASTQTPAAPTQPPAVPTQTPAASPQTAGASTQLPAALTQTSVASTQPPAASTQTPLAAYLPAHTPPAPAQPRLGPTQTSHTPTQTSLPSAQTPSAPGQTPPASAHQGPTSEPSTSLAETKAALSALTDDSPTTPLKPGTEPSGRAILNSLSIPTGSGGRRRAPGESEEPTPRRTRAERRAQESALPTTGWPAEPDVSQALYLPPKPKRAKEEHAQTPELDHAATPSHAPEAPSTPAATGHSASIDPDPSKPTTPDLPPEPLKAARASSYEETRAELARMMSSLNAKALRARKSDDTPTPEESAGNPSPSDTPSNELGLVSSGIDPTQKKPVGEALVQFDIAALQDIMAPRQSIPTPPEPEDVPEPPKHPDIPEPPRRPDIPEPPERPDIPAPPKRPDVPEPPEPDAAPPQPDTQPREGERSRLMAAFDALTGPVPEPVHTEFESGGLPSRKPRKSWSELESSAAVESPADDLFGAPAEKTGTRAALGAAFADFDLNAPSLTGSEQTSTTSAELGAALGESSAAAPDGWPDASPATSGSRFDASSPTAAPVVAPETHLGTPAAAAPETHFGTSGSRFDDPEAYLGTSSPETRFGTASGIQFDDSSATDLGTSSAAVPDTGLGGSLGESGGGFGDSPAVSGSRFGTSAAAAPETHLGSSLAESGGRSGDSPAASGNRFGTSAAAAPETHLSTSSAESRSRFGDSPTSETHFGTSSAAASETHLGTSSAAGPEAYLGASSVAAPENHLGNPEAAPEGRFGDSAAAPDTRLGASEAAASETRFTSAAQRELSPPATRARRRFDAAEASPETPTSTPSETTQTPTHTSELSATFGEWSANTTAPPTAAETASPPAEPSTTPTPPPVARSQHSGASVEPTYAEPIGPQRRPRGLPRRGERSATTIASLLTEALAAYQSTNDDQEEPPRTPERFDSFVGDEATAAGRHRSPE